MTSPLFGAVYHASRPATPTTANRIRQRPSSESLYSEAYSEGEDKYYRTTGKDTAAYKLLTQLNEASTKSDKRLLPSNYTLHNARSTANKMWDKLKQKAKPTP